MAYGDPFINRKASEDFWRKHPAGLSPNPASTLEGMTWDVWKNLSERERDTLRDTSELHPTLSQYRGYRVEVEYYGEKRRFIIGQSTGWRPITLGMYNRRSMGSSNVLTADNCKLLRVIERVC